MEGPFGTIEGIECQKDYYLKASPSVEATPGHAVASVPAIEKPIEKAREETPSYGFHQILFFGISL
jgi:hypothetical protein